VPWPLPAHHALADAVTVLALGLLAVPPETADRSPGLWPETETDAQDDSLNLDLDSGVCAGETGWSGTGSNCGPPLFRKKEIRHPSLWPK